MCKRMCVWPDEKMRTLWQKQVPWWRWLPLMLSDSTEQIIRKPSFSLSPSLYFSLILSSAQCNAAITQSSDIRGRTPVGALSSCTVRVNIRTMLPMTPKPSEHSGALLFSHPDKSTLLFTITCFYLPPCQSVKQHFSQVYTLYCILLWAFFFFFSYGVLLRHF